MASITVIKKTDFLVTYTVNAEKKQCVPPEAERPCWPQDEFDIIESCKICKRTF